jgi:3-oxoacyl-[acyl-carrier protein] reductase
MNIDLTGRRALVCGSTQGIGKASAIELAKMGATVILVARNEQALQQTVKELPAPAGSIHQYLVADFQFPDQLKETVDQFIMKNGAVHILVNNTGGPPGGPIASAKTSEFLQTFNNHLVCNHILAMAVLDGMKQAKFGRIINIISTSVKQPLKGLGVSNTIRAAVANWSKTLAGEVAKFGITVNNVLPGATATARLSSLLEAKSAKTGTGIEDLKAEMIAEIPASRFANPEEIAAAVGFLASPSASYITGINLPVDGGRTLCL